MIYVLGILGIAGHFGHFGPFVIILVIPGHVRQFRVIPLFLDHSLSFRSFLIILPGHFGLFGSKSHFGNPLLVILGTIEIPSMGAARCLLACVQRYMLVQQVWQLKFKCGGLHSRCGGLCSSMMI